MSDDPQTQAPPPAKRSRKPTVPKQKKAVQVVAVVTPDGIEGSFAPVPKKPLIVHLPFSSSEIAFVDNAVYESAPPKMVEPFDMESGNYFEVNTKDSTGDEHVGLEQKGWTMDHVEEKKQDQVITNIKIENFDRAKVLACYETSPGKTFNLPESTTISCYWCSHGFDNQPCFLPVKEESGVFHVYGNFCSPQCGLSYLLQQHLDSHVRWERMALLHRMYRPLGKQGARIYPAPPRETLIKFGGPMTYDMFRAIINENKSRIDVQVPPMVSILGTLDTKPIDFYDSSVQNTFTSGFSIDRFKSWSEQGGALRLKRSKPLKDKESTLDACIQISIRRGGE
jgi:hypothetical protein